MVYGRSGGCTYIIIHIVSGVWYRSEVSKNFVSQQDSKGVQFSLLNSAAHV